MNDFRREKSKAEVAHLRAADIANIQARRERCKSFKVNQPVRTEDGKVGVIKEIDDHAGTITIRFRTGQRVGYSSLVVHPVE